MGNIFRLYWCARFLVIDDFFRSIKDEYFPALLVSLSSSLALDLTIKSFFLDKVMGSLFKKATIKMLDAFEQRARSLHN